MTAKEKAPQSAASSKQEKIQSAIRASDARTMAHLYAPYLIAASFIVMTALLTLLLTVVMDNKAELNQVVSRQSAGPILANARLAFGQEAVSTAANSVEAEAPALLPEETAVSPITTDQVSDRPDNSEDVLLTAIDSLPADNNQALATVDSSSDDPQPTDKSEPLAPENNVATTGHDTDKITGSDADTQNVSESPENATASEPAVIQSTATNKNLAAESDSTQKPLPATKPTPVGETLAATGQDLDRLVNAHEHRIKEIRAVIVLRPDNRRHIEEAITYHLKLMEMQVRHIEKGLRPVYPSVIAAYERMLNHRRDSFQRMMLRREELLQRIYKSRSRLRERYSRLRRMLKQDPLRIV